MGVILFAVLGGLMVAVAARDRAAERRHKHYVPPAEYRKSCTIEGVTIHVEDPTGAAGRCAGGIYRDDGTPKKEGEVSAGCLHPTADLDTGEFVGAEMVIQPNREILWREFEHLYWNACREPEDPR